MIAPRRMNSPQPVGIHPMALDYAEQALRSSPDIEVVERIGPKGLVGTLADGMGGMPHILVVKMADDKAEILRQQSGGQLIVDQDQLLRLDSMDTRGAGLVSASISAAGLHTSVAIMVLGRDNAPLRDAEVHLLGIAEPANAVTDERGVATVSIPGDAVQFITGLYVKPKSDFWSFYQAQPALEVHQTNLVYLRPLSESFQGFPRQQVTGWGQRLMRMDQLPGNYRGQGSRVAIVDSGADTSHPDLHRIKSGFDSLKQGGENTWRHDTVGHGSHCAGIVAAADNSTGIRGFAPEAEVHICKQYPGARVSQLIEALEYCIEKQVDAVSLNLGGIDPSEALEQQILRAKRLGVACIAAAGDTGGTVHYPASSPNVLAVAAIGKFEEYPADSYHAQTAGPPSASGLFSPRFTCYGPEIALCAPGVAILSCVPPSGYAVCDGTSLAAAHVTGLAALIVAHHPEFQGPFKARTSARVDRLFQILRSSAQPVNVGDPRRTGFGIPDVLVAVGLAVHPAVLAAMNLLQHRAGMAGLYGANPWIHPMIGLGFGNAGAANPSTSYPQQAPAGVW